MCKKRKIITITVLFVLGVAVSYLQWGREIGIYIAYTGLIKRETSKAVQAVINFLVVFVLSASFIAYAPDYIKKINEFSSDISTASLDLGTKIMLPNIPKRTVTL